VGETERETQTEKKRIHWSPANLGCWCASWTVEGGGTAAAVRSIGFAVNAAFCSRVSSTVRGLKQERKKKKTGDETHGGGVEVGVGVGAQDHVVTLWLDGLCGRDIVGRVVTLARWHLRA
jgi:hypothetical protein